MSGQAGRDPRVIRLLATLAEALVRPLDVAPEGAVPGLGSSADDLRRMVRHPAFRGPLNRAACRSLGIDCLPIDAGLPQRVAESARTRLALVLVTRPPAEVEAVALAQVGAAVLSRRAVGLILKADRARLREALGEPGFVLATREAPLLYGALADLDALDAAAADRPPTRLRAEILALGLHLLGRLVDSAEPSLSRVFALRLGPHHAAPAHPCEPNPLQLGQILKLVSRRTPAWSPLIA